MNVPDLSADSGLTLLPEPHVELLRGDTAYWRSLALAALDVAHDLHRRLESRETAVIQLRDELRTLRGTR